jgi:hypothetical protein
MRWNRDYQELLPVLCEKNTNKYWDEASHLVHRRILERWFYELQAILTQHPV